MRFKLLILALVWTIAASVFPKTSNAATRAEIAKAIERGVEYLKSRQRPDGTTPEHGHALGGTALVTLALLESKVSQTDPAITKAVAFVRANCENNTNTYDVALSIMLLDKLGKSSDKALIRQLGTRLRDSQSQNGAWSYLVVQEQDAGSSRNRVQQRRVAPSGDNSNTQFAVLGLWVARKNGVDVDEALKRASEYFRATVDQRSGGWAYNGPTGSTPSMTCAGLIALATHLGTTTRLRSGVAGDRKPGAGSNANGTVDAMTDPLVQGALKYLAGVIGNDANNAGRNGRAFFQRGGQDLYFLWSLERVGVIYGLDKIGETNWYDWGADILVNGQQADGSSQCTWGNIAGTCFCLLFLNRSNVAPDLTAIVGGGPSRMRSGASIEDLDRAVRNAQVKRGANSLLDQLSEASNAAARWKLLQRLRDEKGAANSRALDAAIGLLDGEMKERARTALYERYLRMTARTLASRLVDGETETKIAAAKAAAEKKVQEAIPPLIELLADSNSLLSREAHAALVKLTGEDFGPPDNASAVEQVVAQQRWRRWSSTHKSAADN